MQWVVLFSRYEAWLVFHVWAPEACPESQGKPDSFLTYQHTFTDTQDWQSPWIWQTRGCPWVHEVEICTLQTLGYAKKGDRDNLFPCKVLVGIKCCEWSWGHVYCLPVTFDWKIWSSSSVHIERSLSWRKKKSQLWEYILSRISGVSKCLTLRAGKMRCIEHIWIVCVSSGFLLTWCKWFAWTRLLGKSLLMIPFKRQHLFTTFLVGVCNHRY